MKIKEEPPPSSNQGNMQRQVPARWTTGHKLNLLVGEDLGLLAFGHSTAHGNEHYIEECLSTNRPTTGVAKVAVGWECLLIT